MSCVVVASPTRDDGGGMEEEAGASQVVTPWEVGSKDGGKINYDKLIVDFGCTKMDADTVSRIERLTGRPAHPFLRRNVFFAHRYFVCWSAEYIDIRWFLMY